MSKPDFARIRSHYNRHTLAIYDAGKADWGIDLHAWEFDAGIRLSPIERALWGDIRSVGAVLYPQYPVCQFFVDFANPVARVAIECDGYEFHRDEKKDADRQQVIEDNGWIVYRISGSDCLKHDHLRTDALGHERIVRGPAYDFVKQIAERHGIRFSPPKNRKTLAELLDRWVDFGEPASREEA